MSESITHAPGQIESAIAEFEKLTGIDTSAVAKVLAESENLDELKQARTQVRDILDSVTTGIVRAFMFRQEFMGLIAESKKKGDPILQLEREWAVIRNGGNIAQESKEDVGYTEGLIWLITAAAKEKQRKLLNRESVFVKEILTPEDGRKNLLKLTARVAERYDTYGEGFNATRITREEELTRILSASATVKNRGIAIDLGTANGAVARKLAEQGFTQVFGYDVSPDMIRVANKLKSRVSEKYMEIDLSGGIPVEDSSVDFLVSSFGSAGEVHADIISEVSRVLKPGGKAWLSFYNKDAFAHIWWQPQQTSIEVIYNPLAQILEVPIKNTESGSMEVFKIPAKAKSATDIEMEIRGKGLLIEEMESFPLLATMMPPTFFANKANERIALEHDRAHGKMKPFRGYYLNILLQKDNASTF